MTVVEQLCCFVETGILWALLSQCISNGKNLNYRAVCRIRGIHAATANDPWYVLFTAITNRSRKQWLRSKYGSKRIVANRGVQ
jgi:hypothetical protein